MANFESARQEIPIRDDEDTIPDSYSITEVQTRRTLAYSDEALASPSDWRLDIHQVGRPPRHWACPFLYVPILYGYAFLGAWLFTTIEERDNDQQAEIIRDCDSSASNHTHISHMIYDGIPYAISVFTTVGYGVQAPKKKAGKLATIFYALFGIPIYFAFSADFQDWIDQAVFVWMYCLIIRIRNKISNKPKGTNPVPKITRCMKFFWILGITISWMFLQGWLTMLVENSGSCDHWTYMDAIYFVFQSAALIGFGDMMARRNFYLTVHLPMLIIGQVLLTGLFTSAIKYIRYKVPKWICKCVTAMHQRIRKNCCKSKKKTPTPKERQNKKKTPTPKERLSKKTTVKIPTPKEKDSINDILIETDEELKDKEEEKSDHSSLRSNVWV